MCWFPSSVYKSLDRTRLSGHLLSALFQLFLLCNHSSDCVSVALSHGLLMLKARVDGGGGRNPVGELVSSLDLHSLGSFPASCLFLSSVPMPGA